MAKLLAVAMHQKKHGSMIQLSQAHVSVDTGVALDFRGKPGKRQVTVLTKEGWEAANAELGTSFSWLERRANLYIEGLDLRETAEKILRVGLLELLITRETDPCERMKDVHPGLFDVMLKDWRGGVCCRVIHSGDICVGDTVEIIDVE